MITLNDVDNSLKAHAKQITTIAESLVFKPICEFTPRTAKDDIPWNDIVYSGVYLFEVKTDFENLDYNHWLTSFKEGWEAERYKRKFTPNFTKKRIKAHNELLEWMPIYIGKSKQIGGRVHNHLYKELHKPTFAMKLRSRENLLDAEFRLSTVKIEVVNYNMILPKVESYLRNKINPLIGRQ